MCARGKKPPNGRREKGGGGDGGTEKKSGKRRCEYMFALARENEKVGEGWIKRGRQSGRDGVVGVGKRREVGTGS